MSFSASRIAGALAARLDRVVPRPFRVRADGQILALEHPDGWNSYKYLDWMEDQHWLPVRRPLSFIGLLLAGCSGDPDRALSAGRADRPPKVPLPRVVETITGTMPGTWGTGRRIRYETALDITNVPALRQEAESIWARLRQAAERDGVCTVELKASTPTRTVPVPGTRGELFARRNYSFVVRRDSAGAWRWLSSVERPTSPCGT